LEPAFEDDAFSDVIILREGDYRTDELDIELAANPMALAFPGPQTDEFIYSKLIKDPKIRPADFMSWPLSHRKEWIDQLEDFHHPFQMELDFMHKVVSLVRKGLRPRNPADPKVMAFILSVAAGNRKHLSRLSTAGGGGGLGMLVTGPSGTGKTSLVDRLVEYLQAKARVHLSLGGKPCQWKQLGAIRISVQPTWAATLDEVLRAIDQQLGTDFYSKRRRSARHSELLEDARSALTSHVAPILILDEFQRLGNIPKDQAKKIINGLIDIMELEGIPVIVVGTVAVRKLFQQHPAEMSKFSNGGDFEFDRLDEGDQDTLQFLASLKEQHVSTSKPVYAEDFDHRFLLYTMGVRRIMREYMKVIFNRHAEDESLLVNDALLKDIAAKEMSKFERALDSLRKFELGFSMNFRDMEQYEHFVPPDDLAKRSDSSLAQEIEWRNANNNEAAMLTISEFERYKARQRIEKGDKPRGGAKDAKATKETKEVRQADAETEAARQAAQALAKASKAAKAALKAEEGEEEGKPGNSEQEKPADSRPLGEATRDLGVGQANQEDSGIGGPAGVDGGQGESERHPRGRNPASQRAKGQPGPKKGKSNVIGIKTGKQKKDVPPSPIDPGDLK
jgi:GTPase SAR1 family protein